MAESGFNALMHEARVTWGYCGCTKRSEYLHVAPLIPSSGPVHADPFAEWVLLADDVNPNLEKSARFKAAIRAAFVKHMGGEVVDAERLRRNDCGAANE